MPRLDLYGRAAAIVLLALVWSTTFAPMPSMAAVDAATRRAVRPCVGDCDGNGAVSVDEVVKGVEIALGSLAVDRCPRFDCDGVGRVAVDCIIKAIDAALNGCSSQPTASPTPTGTPTRTSTATPMPSATGGATVTASETATHTPTPTTTAANTPTVTPTQPGESVTVFDSRSAFTFAAGALLTDDYEDPGYAEFQDDASMDAVKGLTRYETTFFADFDEVIATPNGHIYAGGFTSGSFQLDFNAPSLGGSGVHAVGFDFANNILSPYVAFVSFADGTSQNFMLHASAFQFLSPPPDFFGLTSSVEITRIHIGLMDGGATSDNLFAIDNLSVAAPETATPTSTRTSTPTATQAAISLPTQTASRSPTATPTATRTTTPTPTTTPTFTATRTATPSPTPSATRTTIDEAALAAAARVSTEPLLRLFDFQSRVGTPGGVDGRSTVPGCQQFDCVAFGNVTGIEEDCCSDGLFTQVFDNCVFDDDLGRLVRLDGTFVLNADTFDVCTGAVPRGGNFAASLSGFTHDVSFPDGSFSRTFQELTETFEVTTGGCTVRQPRLGFGVRGDGRRFIDGELQQFQSDGFGNVQVDSESNVHGLEIVVGSTGQPDDCTITAELNGSLTSADFRIGTQFSADFADFHAVQPPQAGPLLLELDGIVGTDCLGDVTLSTIEPLRVAPGNTCFSAGRLEAQPENGTVSVTYAESGLDFDFGADGSVDEHFAACTDVPADQCGTSVVGLCGACTALDQCQTGLGCFPCSGDCSGSTKRCSLADTFVTCEDGIF